MRLDIDVGRIFNEEQLEILRCLFDNIAKGVTSADAKQRIDKKEGLRYSRASVILFLNGLVDLGLLTYEDESGKGGYHRRYFMSFDPVEFEVKITVLVLEALIKVCPLLETDLNKMIEYVKGESK